MPFLSNQEDDVEINSFLFNVILLLFIFRMHSVILMLESTLFGMFVMAIFIDQMQAILGDQTAVEQLTHQGPYRPFKTKMALLTEICGNDHPFLWLFPCSSIHRRYEENLLNYEV